MKTLAPTRPLTAALIGPPNTGKSSLFNRLTGLRQQIGNYPGVTVERRVGNTRILGKPWSVFDLPGCYSLRSRSPDERIAAEFISGRLAGEERPDVIVCVVNALELSRHLFLALQLTELQRPLVLAVNFIDEAAKQGLRVDVARLASLLGCRVVTVSAREGTGIDLLHRAIEAAEQEDAVPLPPEWPAPVIRAIRVLEERLPSGNSRSRAEALRLLFSGPSLPEEKIAVEAARAEIARGGLPPGAAEAIHLHRLAQQMTKETVTASGALSRESGRTLDRVLTHRIAGPALFLALMALVFQAVYAGAAPLMDGIEALKTWAQAVTATALASWPLLQSLVTDGVLEGVGAFMVFLPQILILFLFIGLLEETGYMARAAYMADRLFSWCGLSGKSFVPLLSSYACAVPGIMATRTIEDPRARLGTILIAPLMSCSARLPVYVLMIGAFVAPIYGPVVAGLALLLAHLAGLVVAIPMAWVFNKWLFRTPAQPFVLELPPYRLPQWRNIGWRVWESGREFVVKAGTVILAITVVIWALLSFPRERIESEAGANLLAAPAIEESWLGQAGKFVQPVFEPAGFDWRVTVGILASFPAREVIIPTLSLLYQLDGDSGDEPVGLREAMRQHRWEEGPRAGQPVFTLPAVAALMLFFALCSQCGPTLAVIARETRPRWAFFAFGYLTALAWLGAVGAFTLGTWIADFFS